MHAPVFQVDKNRKGGKKFAADVKADVKAVIELLYARGMWSKFHYDKWLEALDEMTDEVYLHGWWDSVVNSCMYEVDYDKLREMQDIHEGLAGTVKKHD